MKTIEEVLAKLDEMIFWSQKNNSPMGYFACTYRIMTAQVLKNIQQKKFEDNARMTKLDLAFASRYLEAWDLYKKGEKCTNAWYLAFEAAKNPKLLMLQHLFLGISAHINLDLGIAAASVMPYRKVTPLQKDFNKVNGVITEINQRVQEALGKICYPIELIDAISSGKDNIMLDFAISKARETSWTTAVITSNTPKFLQPSVINLVDYAAAKVASQILNPKLLTPALLSALKKCESAEVSANIKILASAGLK